MTKEEAKKMGATGYHVAKHDGLITYYKNVDGSLYYLNQNNQWEWSGFNEDVPPSQFHNYIKPL